LLEVAAGGLDVAAGGLRAVAGRLRAAGQVGLAASFPSSIVLPWLLS